MRKIFIGITIIALIFLVSVGVVYASYSSILSLFTNLISNVSSASSKDFGGKITKTKATEIQDKEDEGYKCDLSGGTSITIKPLKGPKTYIIPSGTRSKNGATPSSGKQIIGKYGQKTTITCEKECEEEEIDCEPKVEVKLNKITLFGTSKSGSSSESSSNSGSWTGSTYNYE